MRRFASRLVPIVLLLLPATLTAAPATVELVQAPAWLVRGESRTPLSPLMTLEAGDRIETGRRARALLRLAEGSIVKLGADADFHLASFTEPADDGVFTGFLDVLKGAFRFTTTAIGKQRRRNISARLRTATIGIRGTDVWGKAEDARDFVVLLEGSIDIERNGTTVAMTEPLSLFMAPRGAPAEPIRPVDQNDLAGWAAETEPQAGQGIQSGDGSFRLNLASFPTTAGAKRLVAQLARAGYAALETPVSVGGRDWIRVSVPGFAERADAEAVLAALRTIDEFPRAWYDRTRS